MNRNMDLRVGFVLSDALTLSSPAAIGQVAEQVEAADFDSLWVMAREIFPVHTPGLNTVYDGSLPGPDEAICCPIQALAIAAHATQRIKLGISLPNVPFYSPVAIGGSLAALDVLSNGRVQVGLGLGSTADEFAYVTSALSRADSPAAEFVRAVDTIWAHGETSFHGDYYTIPRATGCKASQQRPHPPIYLTAFALAAVQRPAVLLRGGSAVTLPPAAANPLAALRDLPEDSVGAGVVVRAQLQISDRPLGADRALFSGSASQVRGDLLSAAESGATELLLDIELNAAGAFDLREIRELANAPELIAVAA